jgi:hypothetical protein
MATSYRVDSFRSPETGETSETGNCYLILAHTSGPSCVTKRHALPATYSCLFKYCGELLNQLAVIEIFPDLLARSGDDAVTQILIN